MQRNALHCLAVCCHRNSVPHIPFKLFVFIADRQPFGRYRWSAGALDRSVCPNRDRGARADIKSALYGYQEDLQSKKERMNYAKS